MRVAVLTGPERFEIEEVERPEPGAGEVLVRVVASGVCASDLEPWLDGPGDGERRYLGHEVSGVVEAVGDRVATPAPGDRVGVWVTERGYAEHVVARAEHCFDVGAAPLDLALAEPLSCAVNAVERAAPALGDDVVVIGAGFMGNLVQSLVALRGVRRLVVADARPDALQRARALGATEVVDVTRETLADVVARSTDGRGADVTFECTGTQPALTTAGDCTRMSGTLAIVGFHQGEARSVPLSYWNWMAFTLVNGHFRDLTTIMHGMSTGMRLVAGGVLDMAPLVTHRFGLGEIDDAFAALRDKPDGFAKAVITLPE